MNQDQSKEQVCNTQSCSIDKNLSQHWDQAYEARTLDALGWYESSPTPTLDLIAKSGLSKDARILNVGAGATTLIDELLAQDYTGLIANDLSPKALALLQTRLGDAAEKVEWIVDDLTQAKLLPSITPVDLWHDRAVLHFFNEAEEQKSYFDLLRQLVKKGGYVLISTFHLDGAEKCCNLKVHRYNEDMIQERLGDEFQLIEAFKHIYYNPRGEERAYVYTLFERGA